MNQIAHISGTIVTSDQIFDMPNLHEVNEDLLDLALTREGLILESRILQGINGIGVIGMQAGGSYQEAILAIEDGMQAMFEDDPEALEMIAEGFAAGDYASLSGIGYVGRMAELNQFEPYTGEIAGLGNFFKKVGRGIGKGVKAVGKAVGGAAKGVLKVVTAPVRWAIINPILKTQLPKAAPFFLYTLFKEDQLPEKARAKRKRAMGLRNIITANIGGIKPSTFDKIIRNGIMKHSGKTPEQLLANLKAGRVSGIGAGFIAAAVAALIQIISKLLAKGKQPKVDGKDAPEPDDFLTDALRAFEEELDRQPSTPFPTSATSPFVPGNLNAGGIPAGFKLPATAGGMPVNRRAVQPVNSGLPATLQAGQGSSKAGMSPVLLVGGGLVLAKLLKIF